MKHRIVTQIAIATAIALLALNGCLGCSGSIPVKLDPDDRAEIRRFNDGIERISTDIRTLNRNLERLPGQFESLESQLDTLNTTLRGFGGMLLSGMLGRRAKPDTEADTPDTNE